MTELNESNQPENEHHSSGSALNCLVMQLQHHYDQMAPHVQERKTAKLLLAAIAAIANLNSNMICETCEHWEAGEKENKCDEDLMYCKELHYSIAVNKYVHTTADFGCIKHSAGETEQITALEQMLEARMTTELEWCELWPSAGPEGNSLDANVKLRATVHDCINLARAVARHNRKPTMGNDREFLLDFIAVHAARACTRAMKAQ